MSSAKLVEANKLIANAEKCMKTSFFNRTPDYESAIENYTKAAVIFRNHQLLKEAAEAYVKVAELNLQNRSYFHSAKNYETAAQVYGEMKDYEKMSSFISQAGEILRQYGTPDSASYVYERAAKSLEDVLPQIATGFYEKSSEACKIESKYHQAAAQVNNAARIQIACKRFDEAERLLRLYMDYITKANTSIHDESVSGLSSSNIAAKLSGRAITAIIIIKLYHEDEVAANKVFNEGIQKWSYSEAEEFPAIRRLLGAVEEMDKDACLEILKDPKLRLLDVHYLKLLRNVKFEFAEFSQPTSGSAVTESSNLTESVENQDEEDIC